MHNIARIKEVLDSLGSLSSDLRYCLHPDDAENLRITLGSVKRQLLDSYDNSVSQRFASLNPKLHSLFNENFSSLILSVSDLQQVHDSRIRAQHVDPNVFRNLLLTHIHPILKQIDQRLLAMHSTLAGLRHIARRNP